MKQILKFQNALLPTGWVNDLLVQIGDDGNISSLNAGITATANEVSITEINGSVIPGVANLHSHAHQRAMAGLAEKSGPNADSFWSWRKVMYQFMERIQPHHLHAIASQLYLEMLLAGYTHVAEFQYLHHQRNGEHFENIAEMSLQTLNAAQDVGMGITSLPVHYQFGGFGEQSINEQQARFFNKPDTFLQIVESIQAATAGVANANLGVAAHSLRASSKESFTTILKSLDSKREMPIHIHIAEQIKEVEDCVSWSGVRPVDYCLNSFPVDENWCMVHATHMSDAEILRLAGTGAVVGLCPTTEANLGDGVFNASAYLNAGGKLGIGSDSHISVSPVEELRWFEYVQRLMHKSRNHLAGGANSSTGRNILDIVVTGGVQACGYAGGAIEVGKRADFVVLDTDHPLLVGRDQDYLLDSWIFSGNVNTVKEVYVGGKQLIKDGHHKFQEQINQRFRDVVKDLIY